MARKASSRKGVSRHVKATARKHPLDRMQFWAGIGLFALSSVMFLHGIDMTMYLASSLGGALAIMFE